MNSELTLYHIADQYKEVLDIIDHVEDPDILDESIWAALEDVEGSFEKKMENYGYIIKRFEAENDYLKNEIDRLKKRKEIREKKILWLKENIKNVFLGLDLRKVETPNITVRLQQCPPGVTIKDETKIPNEFKEIVVSSKVRKREILEHYKLTGDVPDGADISTGCSLRIA